MKRARQIGDNLKLKKNRGNICFSKSSSSVVVVVVVDIVVVVVVVVVVA